MEIGSGYFGCRNDDGTFNADKFRTNALDAQVKMIEIKLSQGPNPAMAVCCPAPRSHLKLRRHAACPSGKTACLPLRTARSAPRWSLMHFIARLRELSGGKPVGFKLCIGHPWEWFGMVKAMLATGITPDFIVVDGSEGGTGAAPLEFTDHVETVRCKRVCGSCTTRLWAPTCETAFG